MTSRFRSFMVVFGLLGLAGCDGLNSGPIAYRDHERFATDLKDKPLWKEAIRSNLASFFGESPQKIVVPADSGLPQGGAYLASHLQKSAGAESQPVYYETKAGGTVVSEGGYALYRRHCLHCHGVSGAGDGPTANFLYPRPRDYRPGIYKFTSTNPTNAKPTRDDLAKTIRNGLHGTSMPAFEALMTEAEIQQTVDYVIFLSMRGEVETRLIEEAVINEESGVKAFAEEDKGFEEAVKAVVASWKAAEGQVVNPSVRRTPPTRESIERGKALFLGVNKTGNKLACADCHGLKAMGDGSNFVEKPIFDKVVFQLKTLDQAIEERYREIPDEQLAREMAKSGKTHGSEHDSIAPTREDFEAYKNRTTTTWKQGSLDGWGNPLRAANLNLGVYKGGRRPLDLYWRIAKGINNAKMPAHNTLISDAEIWDVVNFVLALPYEPDLLKDAEALKAKAAPAPAPKVADARP